ncbi:Uma2 family endonuclease [Paludisphaera rhizosphaerae]|uniref:Uma2 family endonuclease n=1 Tax=Paludisphaera rhizosphaerae TaxID=2711216 RepID=UPI0013ECB509|nr:Uma2 family endonuclease [Paludisphaera rhizosphaerae]
MSASTRKRVSARATNESSSAFSLNVPQGVRLIVAAEDFEKLCAEDANRELRLERESDGGLIVMAPAGSDGGRRNNALSARLWNWNDACGLGEAFDSSSGFTFPNGAVRAADAAWILKARWEAVPADDRARFARIVPDFVAELRSPGDGLKELQAKMAEYIAQGVRLGWLIDPTTQAVEVYRPGREPETLTRPTSLSGEDVLPGLVLDLKRILFD